MSLVAARARVGPLRILAVGDIGRTDAFHVGDESMMLGLIDAVKRSGAPVEWTVMSGDPAQSANLFGVRAVPNLTFHDCSGPDEREHRLAEIEHVLQSPPAGWPKAAAERWREPLAAIGDSDAVVIAGGGNIARSWPELVYERAAVARAARRAGRPLAVTGQTIGPSFDQRTRELAIEILSGCAFAGMREEHSYELAREMGVPLDRIALQFDDAVGVAGVEPPGLSDITGGGDFIAVTLNELGDIAHGHGIVPLLARQLVELSRRTSAAIVLVPHVGDLDGSPAHDVAMARAILAAADGTQAIRVAPVPSPEHAVWWCEHAQMVLSTRYHPVVFAVATGTPVLFLYQDHYTLVKGRGALDLAGLPSWSLSVGLAASGLLVPAGLELWNRRHDIRAHLRSVAPVIEQARREHVDALLGALRLGQPRPIPGKAIVSCSGPTARGEWVERAHDGLVIRENLRDQEVPSAHSDALQQRLAHAGAYATTLEQELERKDAELVTAHGALTDMSKKAEEAHTAWQSDRESLVLQLQLLEQRAATAEQWAGVLAAEVQRKEADLVIAHSALEDVTKRLGETNEGE